MLVRASFALPSHPGADSDSGQGVAQHFNQVTGWTPGAVLYLLTAGHAHNGDFPLRPLGVHRWEERVLTDVHGDLVVLFLEAE